MHKTAEKEKKNLKITKNKFPDQQNVRLKTEVC